MLRWAHRQELIDKVPRIDMPRKTATMSGRPITGEEFERMLAAVPKATVGALRKKRTRLILRIVRAESAGDTTAELRTELRCCNAEIRRVVASWRFLLRGLWWSGLRLAEALELDWTDDRRLCVDFTGRRPMFRIRPDAQKSGKDSVLPMAPEFAEFLQATPDAGRNGRIFNPLPAGKNPSAGSRMRSDSATKIISDIGKAAKVKVSESKRGDKVRVKFASAHDLRRSFGFRWSTRVMPPVLQQLMRHESIETTMRFYVGRNAEAAADALWEAVESGGVAKQSANTRPDASPADTVATP